MPEMCEQENRTAAQLAGEALRDGGDDFVAERVRGWAALWGALVRAERLIKPIQCYWLFAFGSA
jgi:hypothetical protein